jgi:hypothetical protein
MAVPTVRGTTDPAEWYSAPGDRPPIAGDLILMQLPAGHSVPPGWTRLNDEVVWRWSDGTERTFLGPATWYSGVEPIRSDGTTT